MGPSCDYVTEENREAWQRFVENKIREVMKPETMELPEFKECVRYVEEEKRKREEYERREKELRSGYLPLYSFFAHLLAFLKKLKS